MRLKETDYKRCWMNPYQPKFLSNIQEELSSFKDFDDMRLGKKKIYTWIVMMYDPASPWWHEIRNYWSRKREAAIEAGFEIDGNSFEKKVEEFLTGGNDEINKMIAAYISRFANPEYTQLIGLLELQHHMTQDMVKGKYDSTTTKTLNAVTEDINRITSHLFGSGEEDEVLAAKKALYQEAEDARIKLNPENIVKYKNEHGELPDDFNPYGDYEVEESKFISDEGEKDPIQV